MARPTCCARSFTEVSRPVPMLKAGTSSVSPRDTFTVPGQKIRLGNVLHIDVVARLLPVTEHGQRLVREHA